MRNIFSTFSLSKARNQRIIESIEEDKNKVNTELEEEKYNLNNMNKIKINNIEISVEEFKRLAKENEALLKEPEVKGRYFFPKVGETHWYIMNYGEITKTQNTNDIVDKHNISTGNCYRTKEEAELALKKQQAIVRCWKWQQENAPFEPDWGNRDENKYFVFFDCVYRELAITFDMVIHCKFALPYFKSNEDCKSFIEANKEDLLLLFNK